mmetsp:Transcript_28554/g.57117  ORF Transcript_28554/g.57117 Transcript_28554/m.57117 type:complete len:452 (-) Transcript_28554:892-2247(-)
MQLVLVSFLALLVGLPVLCLETFLLLLPPPLLGFGWLGLVGRLSRNTDVSSCCLLSALMTPASPRLRRLEMLLALLPLDPCSEDLVVLWSRAFGRSSHPTFMRSDISMLGWIWWFPLTGSVLELLPTFWLIWANKFQSSSSRDSDLTEFVRDIFPMERSATEVAQLRRPMEPRESRVEGLERLLLVLLASMRWVSPSSSSVWGGKMDSPGKPAVGDLGSGSTLILRLWAAMAASMVASPNTVCLGLGSGAGATGLGTFCLFFLPFPRRPLMCGFVTTVAAVLVVDSADGPTLSSWGWSSLSRLGSGCDSASSLGGRPMSPPFFCSGATWWSSPSLLAAELEPAPASQLFSPSGFPLSLSRLMSLRPRRVLGIEKARRSELTDSMDSSLRELCVAALDPLAREGTLGDTLEPPHFRRGTGWRGDVPSAASTSRLVSCMLRLLKLISTLRSEA